MTLTSRGLLVALLLFLSACGQLIAPASEAPPLDRGLAAYEQLRASLAHDDLDGLTAPASDAEVAFAAAAADATGPTADTLLAASKAAHEVGAASDPDAARRAFGALSQPVIAVISADADHQGRLHRFTCPMAPGFGEWVQPTPKISNPYMGTAMLTCGSALSWEAPHDHGEGIGDDDEIAYWTCSMHPSVQEADPGACPICSMDLTPVTRGQLESGAVLVDAVRRQRYGVRTAAVERRALVVEVDAVGSVTWDASRLRDVTLRAEAWVERLHVDEPGEPVRRGQALATLYSPAVYAAERELLATQGTPLEAAARDRLRLLGLQTEQIEAVLASGEARDTVALLAPISGVVVDRDVVEGAHRSAGSRLFRIAALDRVWIEAELYEDDLELVGPGAEATIRRAGAPPVSGTVERVEPWVERATRRATVRVVADNPDGAWTPGQYVDMALRADLGEGLSVPAEAVIFTGRRRIVFVDEGEDRLVPRDVDLGRRAGDWFEVRDGLAEGDQVVRSGTFVVAAESRIRAAETYWGADHEAR